MDGAEVDGAPVPARAPVSVYRLVWPCGTRPLKLIALADRFSAIWTHFIDGRTVPCPGSPACTHCPRLLPVYQAFIPACSYWPRGLRVAVFGEWVSRQLLGVRQRRGGLRGIEFTLQRRPGRKNAPVDVIDHGPTRELARVPGWFDPWPSVLTFWGMDPQWRPPAPPSAETLAARENAGPAPLGPGAGVRPDDDWRTAYPPEPPREAS